jgi:hypothetical protein
MFVGVFQVEGLICPNVQSFIDVRTYSTAFDTIEAYVQVVEVSQFAEYSLRRVIYTCANLFYRYCSHSFYGVREMTK